MKTKTVICGAGGLSKEIYYLLERLGIWEVIAFLDKEDIGGEILGVPVLSDDFFSEYHEERIAVVFGLQNSEIKKKIYESAKNIPNIFFPKIISPTAHISPGTQIGNGTVITDNCWISNDVTIGNCVLVDIACMIGHDTIIGDYCSVMPTASISGNVTIGACSFIGGKSFIRQGIVISEHVIVGAGAVVISPISDCLTVVGNPARALIKNSIE